MKRRRGARYLAWLLGGLSVAMFGAGFALLVSTRIAQGEIRVSGIIESLLVDASFLAFTAVGVLLASRRPRNPIGWLLLADGFLWMLAIIADYYREYEQIRPGSLPFPAAVISLNEWVWVPAIGLFGVFLLLLFPDGRLLSRRWRPFAWFSGAVLALLSLGFLFATFGIESQPWLEFAPTVILPLLPLCILVSAASLVMRFLRSSGETRQQIKWVVLAAAFMGALYLALMAFGLISTFLSGDPGEDIGPSWLESVMLLSFAGIPIAVGVAVMKYRLYDIEILINRALVYGSLTVSLVAVYVGSVVSLQYAFRLVTGGESQLVIVASTLVIAALFNPLRRRIQAFVDRRFYRRKYDAAMVLQSFSATLREETDLDRLCDELVAVTRETVQPTLVSLWLKTPERKGTAG